MKTRSKFIQGICIFLLLTALTLGFSVSALASSTSTTLLTTVPSHFLVGVTIVGEGSVVINDNKLTSSTRISIERHQTVEIDLLPGDKSHVESIVYNGVILTEQENGGSLLLPALEKDAELIVTFAVNPSAPNTGDGSFPKMICYGIIAIISLFTIILLTVKRNRYNQ